MGTESRPARHSAPDPREEALKTLLAWEKGKGNLDLSIHEHIRRVRKDSRAFYLEMVKGTVRNLALLDYRIEKISERDVSSFPPPIRNILRLGAYQIGFMSIPKPVTVHLMVELAKSHGHPGTVRLVNGVLRKFAAGADVQLPSDRTEAIGILHSHPGWLVERWLSRFGEESTVSLMEWNNAVPPLDVRINRTRIAPEEFLEVCARHGIPVTRTELEEAFEIEASGPIEKIPGYKEGFFWIQSISALFPALLLNPKRGESIVDLCAAPGGKSCQLAEMAGDEAEILAVEVREERLRRVEENQRRLGFRSIRPLLADGRELGAIMPASADAVLLDAPCSATGSFRRKVDARWNKSKEDLEKYAKLQAELLESAAGIVKPGGRIVYATCSLEPEENQSIVREFLAVHSGFTLEEPHPPLPKSILERHRGAESFVEILPQRDRLDGFFAAELRKNGQS